MKLMCQALTKCLLGLLAMGVVLFLPAGTWRYPGGWRFCAALFLPMIVLGIVLSRKAPELLKKRLNMKETHKSQQGIVAAAGLLFAAAFVIAGLDFRFGWTRVPGWLVYTAVGILLAAYAMYAEVLRENAYLSRTVEVQENQKVIDIGLYGIVRHPMYTATIALFLAMPLVLGSWASFGLMLLYPAVIVCRIRSEEQILLEGLEGYADYRRRVRWRLIPFLW